MSRKRHANLVPIVVGLLGRGWQVLSDASTAPACWQGSRLWMTRGHGSGSRTSPGSQALRQNMCTEGCVRTPSWSVRRSELRGAGGLWP